MGAWAVSNPMIRAGAVEPSLRTQKAELSHGRAEGPRLGTRRPRKLSEAFLQLRTPPSRDTESSRARGLLEYVQTCWQSFTASASHAGSPKQEMQDSSRTLLAPDAAKTG